MAPIKFEENIKEKLEKRTIEPSVHAWKSLEKQLDTGSQKQSKTKFLWFGIAAGFIGFLFVVQYFVSFEDSNSVVSPTIVESEESINHSIKSLEIIKKTERVVQEQVENVSENEKLNIVSTSKNKTKNKVEKGLNSQKKKPLFIKDIAITTKNNQRPKEVNTTIKEEENVVAFVANTTGSLKNKENQRTTLKTSESEIEVLLQDANKKILLTDNNSVKTISVDASALLEDVETEIPPSLRGQLFKVIEKNFKTATTAVTTRNE